MLMLITLVYLQININSIIQSTAVCYFVIFGTHLSASYTFQSLKLLVILIMMNYGKYFKYYINIS